MFRKGSSLICRKISTSHSLRNRIRVTVKAAFGKYLFLTNTVSSGVLMLMGDAIQQELSYQSKALTSNLPRDETRFDYGQMTRMFLVGLGMGPTHHYYYRYISILWPKRDMMSITKKIAADQFIMSPICIAQFFVTIGLLEMKNFKEYTQELKQKFISVYVMDWCIWPPAQFINFYLIPVRYQVIYINTATMIYNVFLSYIKHSNVKNVILE